MEGWGNAERVKPKNKGDKRCGNFEIEILQKEEPRGDMTMRGKSKRHPRKGR